MNAVSSGPFRHLCFRSVPLLAVLFLVMPAAADEAHHAPARKPARLELGSSAAFAPDGKLFAVGKEGDYVTLRSSGDEGRSWSEPLPVNAAPEAVAADGEGRPKIAFAADGALLVSWVKPLARPYSGEIRLARSEDGGKRFAAPITVHRDRSEITHRFESLAVGKNGRVTVAWIDKRDQEAAKAGKRGYRGAAIYAAVSDDGGKSFKPEQKVADHSCECCRTTVAHDADGAPLVFWRHVFAPNERDHALARLKADGTPESVQRATFERWKVDACPHHGPALAVDAQGIRHAVWFNQQDGAGRVFYGRLASRGEAIAVDGQRPVGGPRAAHADVAAAGGRVAVAWKEFDGENTRLLAMVSTDGGNNFSTHDLAATGGASDQPRLIARGDTLFAFWRTAQEGFRLYRLP